jgi:spoIIIJ-associated protein
MTEDDAKTIVDFTNDLLKSSRMKLQADAEPAPDDTFKVQVRGEDVAILLGHNAELLDAIEYLGNRVLSKGREEETHVIFDSGNYRARREKELHLMAEMAAEKVRLTRIPFKFDPMSSNERRIIHVALANEAGVRTESKGNGDERRLVVFPA